MTRCYFAGSSAADPLTHLRVDGQPSDACFRPFPGPPKGSLAAVTPLSLGSKLTTIKSETDY